MAFYEKFELARTKFVVECKKVITENFENMFNMWLHHEADMEIGHIYQDIFKEYFGDYITNEVKSQLWFAGKNIIYAISAFMIIKKEKYKLKDLLDFVDTFIAEQMDNFENDYECCEWFNEEAEHQEDNPS